MAIGRGGVKERLWQHITATWLITSAAATGRTTATAAAADPAAFPTCLTDLTCRKPYSPDPGRYPGHRVSLTPLG